ncbi:MAG: TlpA disulfide reductase family protein [Dysgonomonas sp.]|nr:TlpA disulfide reductase family protein [Dysgonomonas sp.]
MRKALVLTLILAIATNIFSQKVIENPYFEVKNSGIDNITRIELSDKDTRVHVHTTFLHNWWVKFPRTTFIQPEGSDTKILATGIEKGEFDKEIFMPESADSTFVLIFPPLDKSVKRINYGEEDKTIIFGISLETNKKKLAQLKVEKEKSEQEKYAAHESWLTNQLAKASKKEPMKDFSIANFFNPDTARLIGYIKGYDPQLGFSTSVIYMGNELTREDYPTVMKIDSCGRFDVKLWIQYPITQYLNINNKSVTDIYIEPGQTLGLVLDWQEFLIADRLRNISYKQKVEYKGPLADINKEINGIQLKEYDWRTFENDIKSLSPNDFKQKITQFLADNKALINKAEEEGKLSTKSKILLNNANTTLVGERLLDYNSMRGYFASQDSTNMTLKIPLDDNYYDFLQQIPLNDPGLLISNYFSSFVNRFEYCDPFREAHRIFYESKKPIKTFYGYLEEEAELTAEELSIIENLRKPNEESEKFYNDNKEVIEAFNEKYKDLIPAYQDKYGNAKTQDQSEKRLSELRDSIYTNVLGLQPSLVYDIVKMREICSNIASIEEREKSEKIVTAFSKSNANPYLKKQTFRFFNNMYPESGSRSYDLPETHTASLFKKMIEPFKGKYILVDFWESWCGPCVGGIKGTQAVREKLKDSQDIAFVYICSTDTPLDKYNSFIEEQGLKHTYRLSSSEYEYMRELFKFNGIPHYETVDREGRIMYRGLSPYSIESTFEMFLEKEKNSK